MQTNFIELLDYRRQIAEIYRSVRELAAHDPALAWRFWRQRRDLIFKNHSQSALSEMEKAHFNGLSYYEYDPAYRFHVAVHPAMDDCVTAIRASTGEDHSMLKIGMVDLPVGRLNVYWLNDYAGGIFIPFKDETSGDSTYGGGRYILDTAKSADLGSLANDELILDFNFAYNPSCHYDPRWNCPLSPPENRLDIRLEAGEKRFGHKAKAILDLVN